MLKHIEKSAFGARNLHPVLGAKLLNLSKCTLGLSLEKHNLWGSRWSRRPTRHVAIRRTNSVPNIDASFYSKFVYRTCRTTKTEALCNYVKIRYRRWVFRCDLLAVVRRCCNRMWTFGSRSRGCGNIPVLARPRQRLETAWETVRAPFCVRAWTASPRLPSAEHWREPRFTTRGHRLLIPTDAPPIRLSESAWPTLSPD